MWAAIETYNAVHIVHLNDGSATTVHDLHFGCDCDFLTVAVDGSWVPVVIHAKDLNDADVKN